MKRFKIACVYRNYLKNREFDKEAPQNFHLERATIVQAQGASEDENFEEKPTPSKLDFSSSFGIYCLSMLAVLLVVCAYKRLNSAKMYLCNHAYALCTSARCIPQPGDETKAICFCDVEDGNSMSTLPCNQLRPSSDAKGIDTVYSTFSYEQYKKGKKTMQCPGGTPWTWCLNKKCTVDPSDPSKAICLCDIMRTSEEWITLGGSCDTSTCNTAYWSGATLKDFEEGNLFMKKNLNLDQTPVKWCPANP